MRGIFIRVTKGEKWYNKDLLDAAYEERMAWYDTLDSDQKTYILERFVSNQIKGEK